MSTALLPVERDIAFFQENGYWIAPKLIDDHRLDILRQRMEDVYQGKFETGNPPWRGYWKPGDGQGLRKTDNAHWADLAIRSLALDPVIGEIAAILMQTDTIRLWHDQLLYKPGRGVKGQASANVGWHQDYSYWQCAAEPTLLTAWVAFDDVDLSNGCMQFVSRSHNWGLVNINDFFEQDLKKQEEQLVLPEGESFQKVPCIMKAGQVSFHHALTIHGSGANTTDSPRRSLAIHLMTGNTRYKTGTRSDNHMNVQLLKGRNGDIFAGDSFPVVYNQEA